MVVACNTIGLDMLKALDLPTERCREVRIVCTAGDIVRVEAEYYPDKGQFDKMINVIRVIDRRPG